MELSGLTSTTWSKIETRKGGKDCLSAQLPHPCHGSVAMVSKNFCLQFLSLAYSIQQQAEPRSCFWQIRKKLTEKKRVIREVIRQIKCVNGVGGGMGMKPRKPLYFDF